MKVFKFPKPIEWPISGREVSINRLECSRYDYKAEVPAHKELESIDSKTSIKNVIKNVGILHNASFFEIDNTRIVARIHDVVGLTLIRTEWVIPSEVFNMIVTTICYESNLDESLFHVMSKNPGGQI